MANVIQIKRSATHSSTTAPTNLAVGELGYVQGSKELYICRATDNTGGTEIIHAALPLGGADTIDTVGEIGTGTWAADVIGSSYLPDATTEVEGVVELASNDETNTGTDTSRALTASNLTAWASDTTTAIASGKLPTASTTQVGITVLADSTETNTGTDANMITASAIATILFMGGWSGPTFGAPPLIQDFVLPTFWFVSKIFVFILVFMLIRATLPRIRYDQLMAFGWKILLPLALANLVVTSFLVAIL